MKIRNLFWGMFFILAAVLIIMNQLGILVGISLFNLIITIFLVSIIIKSIQYLNFVGIIMPLAILGVIYADKLGIQSLTPWPILGSALFLSIGLSIIIHPRRNEFEECHCKKHDDKGEFVEIQKGEKDDSEVNLYTKFSGSVKYITSENLKTVNLDCSFGALKVYFDNAKIDGNEATVNLNLNFGGAELYIPKEWSIINNVSCSVGGIDEKGQNDRTSNIKLILKGKINFSGVEIIYI